MLAPEFPSCRELAQMDLPKCRLRMTRARQDHALRCAAARLRPRPPYLAKYLTLPTLRPLRTYVVRIASAVTAHGFLASAIWRASGTPPMRAR